ncbi:unnamed protein product [Durusdinium trenchii]|uniref:non-specific serine/threonine protein kinase n=1 Tax=Durusdinium trenchii TaxID=1381693 RepID=A0ABP0JQX5_9DINO
MSVSRSRSRSRDRTDWDSSSSGSSSSDCSSSAANREAGAHAAAELHAEHVRQQADDATDTSEDLAECEEGSHEIRPRMLLCDRFHVRGKLGTGAFASVWLCHDRHSLVALKVYKAVERYQRYAQEEVEMLQTVANAGNRPQELPELFGPHGHMAFLCTAEDALCTQRLEVSTCLRCNGSDGSLRLVCRRALPWQPTSLAYSCRSLQGYFDWVGLLTQDMLRDPHRPAADLLIKRMLSL